jgi:hypothetical protein
VNISATGFVFVADIALEVHTRVQATLTLPAQVAGTLHDIAVHYVGRVVRCNYLNDSWHIGVVIDEYHFSQ